ncbi:6-bladed beta-propeller [Paraflavitalea pollutisoli]|uniref:6-bladed beta-propeller n=1 Tax=Paraflavitalea pollutisoli TaxID=3034143 RepID=UPI0023EDFBD1|nr:6-bladed beta-propeller [Paraflavitalea sp. H1-2-19X]
MNCIRGLFLIACSLSIALSTQSQVQKIYLHPKAAGSEKQSKFIDSVRFIPLEVTPDAQFTQYSNVEVTRDYFMIRNYQAKELVLYDKQGRYIKKISYKKLAGDLYPAYDLRTNQLIFFGYNSTYALTPKDQIKIEMDWSSPKNKKYFKKYSIDLNDSTFAIKKEKPEQKDIIRAYHFYDDIYAAGVIKTSELFTDSLDYEYKLYRDNKFIKGFWPYNRINELKYQYQPESISIGRTDTPYINYITRPYSDIIYKMVHDSITPYYQVVLPLENSLPQSFFTKPFKNKTEKDNFRRNNGMLLHAIHPMYENDRFLYFMVAYLYNWEAYIYQKQTQVTHKAKNIKGDSSQYNLSLLSDFGLTRNKDQFYKTQKAGDLISYFEKHKDVAIPPELEKFIKSNPPATSPIIIEFKFKN